LSATAEHVIPDVLESGLDVVFCGTAPSATSKERGAYYARPGNRFWPTLYSIGLTPRQLEPEEFRTVTDFGIGLTDVCKLAWGQDADLAATDFEPEALREKIQQHAPRYLAFTSKRAAREFLGRNPAYGIQPDVIGEARLFVLPSTSGLATRFWDETFWQELALRLRDGSGA
jgi:TDG/mug DNA glycosylase family protein